MIILKHLTVERFRLLRELNLHFPQRGGILIQGPNEAGKSALLESIHFALYGQPLLPTRKRSLDDLILYGSSTATVTLTLSVGPTELVITRSLERGQPQQVLVLVQTAGQDPQPPMTDLYEANEAIQDFLGFLDSDTLRNSCLIEQKSLERVEHLSQEDRDFAIDRLLGIEQLLDLSEQYQLTPADEEQLQEAKDSLRLAEVQTRIPTLSDRAKEVDAALDVVEIRECVTDISQQEAEILEQEEMLEEIKNKRYELKSRLNRIRHLQRADSTLDDIINAYDEIAEARREIPELDKEITELERSEVEELPQQEERVNELAELSRSFGTLQHMSNDLLGTVDTVKGLEEELRHQAEAKSDLISLGDQVRLATLRVEEAQQALTDLEERRRVGRPQLEARFQRLNYLTERLKALQQLEAQFTKHVSSKDQVADYRLRLQKIQSELYDTEEEQNSVEIDSKRLNQQMETVEQQIRQIYLRRQFASWQQVKALVESLQEASEHVRMAHQQQGSLTQASLEARRKANSRLLMLSGSILGLLIAVVLAIFGLTQGADGGILLIIGAVLAVICFVFVVIFGRGFRRVREEQSEAEQGEQEATANLRTAVDARENATRRGGSTEELALVEEEIRTLGSQPPRSLAEVGRFLELNKDQGENLSELQKHDEQLRNELRALQSRVGIIQDAIAGLRKTRSQLEERRQKEDWDHLDENILMDQASLLRLHQEITLLASQEGLSLNSINARLQQGVPIEILNTGQFPALTDEIRTDSQPVLDVLVEGAIASTERDLHALDIQVQLIPDFQKQVKIHQEALEVLINRRQAMEELCQRYELENPAVQIQQVQEQQAALRQALQSLQESLRQRVKPLDVAFGQTAISNAEQLARRALEQLQIRLGSKVMLQQKQAKYHEVLRTRQEELAELYKQLAKYSNTLGSWIVPQNPFAEALLELRIRCAQELANLNEGETEDGLNLSQEQEGASRAKIALCTQEIELNQETITQLLALHQRTEAKEFTLEELTGIWSLLKEYTVADQVDLLAEKKTLAKELTDLKREDQTLSARIKKALPSLELASEQLERQERDYQTRKHGQRLLRSTAERMRSRVLPRVEHYTEQFLRQLTAGRYHDIRLSIDEGNANLLIQAWDSAAGEYIPKVELSSGVADQLSLALRLAFVVAIVSPELSTAPGFLFLDEPLSSFDRTRTRALVDVITGEQVSTHFEQVFLISQNHAFDASMFPYHIYMDDGVVIESNLPNVRPSVPETPRPSTVLEQELNV